jgi:hypothetical protein
VWDYSDSLLLYIPGSDESYETLQAIDNPYHRLVTAPERSYLESIAGSIAKELPQSFEYIDLGPGTEHKEQFLFDALKKERKSFMYRPVDVSRRFLRLSVDHARAQGIACGPIYNSFEELPNVLPKPTIPRFVSLGLTYSNYEPKDILPLLKRIAGAGGTAFINAQLRERTDMEALVKVYENDAKDMIEGKIRLLGLDPASDLSSQRIDDGVRVWCTLRTVNEALKKKNMKEGDELLIFESLRPTRESLEEAVQEEFPNHTSYDTGGPFVATLLKP